MKYLSACFFITVMLFILPELFSHSSNGVILSSYEGGRVTDGADIRIIEWERHQASENITLHFYDWVMSETIAPMEYPCAYHIQKELYPHRLIITLNGARSLSAGFPDIHDSVFIEDFYSLMMFDDSTRALAITLKKPSDIKILEFHNPGRLIIEFSKAPAIDLPPLYSLRTRSQKAGEWLMYFSEDHDSIRTIKDRSDLFFVELGYFLDRRIAESEMNKIDENLIIEKRGPYDIPANFTENDRIIISGRITDFDDNPVPNALIDLKNSDFSTAHKSYSSEDGQYSIKAKKGKYIGLFAMDINEYPHFSSLPQKDQRLEFWAWDLIADRDMTIDIRYHRLEIYGVNAFRIQGAYPGYMLYFRPMSLSRIMSGMQDMAPLPENAEIKVEINGLPVQINHIQRVREYVPEAVIYGYLLHVSLEETENDKPYNKFKIYMKDLETGDMGEALYFQEKPDYF